MMNVYIKEIDGKKVIKPQNQIIVEKDGIQIFNPDEDLLFEEGWVIYKPNSIENKSIDTIKREKIKEIEHYDSSELVNIFYLQGKSIWVDKSTRVGLNLRFSSEEKKGLTETTLWYKGESFTLPLDMAKNMLLEVELYASECYDITQQHISNVNNITNKEDVLEYNYREGYPEKLDFQYN
jgi:hypothetical protein